MPCRGGVTRWYFFHPRNTKSEVIPPGCKVLRTFYSTVTCRVTRLGEISPSEWLFTLGHLFC
jgi:hypothetical protein